MKKHVKNIMPGLFVSYYINKKQYIGKVIDVDNENGIAYVWYGYGILEAATDINKLEIVNLEESNILQYENNTLFEMISLNDYDKNGLYCLKALHNMIKALNTEFKFIPVINELDYVLHVKDYVSFVKCVNDLRKEILERKEKI